MYYASLGRRSKWYLGKSYDPRVLIFQHRGLWHSGDDVVQGVKYTVRSDIMYKRVDRIEQRSE